MATIEKVETGGSDWQAATVARNKHNVSRARFIFLYPFFLHKVPCANLLDYQITHLPICWEDQHRFYRGMGNILTLTGFSA